MTSKLCFVYSWHIDEQETEGTSIRIYGLDRENKNICLRVDDFTPYVYIELPCKSTTSSVNIEWNNAKSKLVGSKIDELLSTKKPLYYVLVWKKKLYGAYLDDNLKRKEFPYLFCKFASKQDIKSLGFVLKKTLHIAGLGPLKFKIHESDADPILQLTCFRSIPTVGWVRFAGEEIPEDDKLTLCDYEFSVKYKNMKPYDMDYVPKPKIMGFDIEVNSNNPTAMPKAEKSKDVIFQISCVIAREGDGPELYEKYLFTLGEPDNEIVGLDTIVYMCKTEGDLLLEFTQFIREENPNIIVGYNILGFDIPYMIARLKCHWLWHLPDFSKQGFHITAMAKERTIRWSSSAYKNQEFEFLDAEGRVYVDLLPLVRRDFKFNNYKLKTVSEYFVGQTKDPLSPQGIFKCYRIGMQKNINHKYTRKAQKAMGIVGKYCVQDSALVVMLTDKLKTWVGLTEMAKTCNVSMFSLYTQGQQIKVYSQLYKYCMHENIVVEKDAYQVTESERYVGAKVFDPIPGKYDKVVPFDFASLYPTTIIAYNIDYHTWVPPDSDIPDRLCHVMEWEDHLGCCHDPKVIRKNELTQYINAEQQKFKKLREKRDKTKDKDLKKQIISELNAAVEALKPYTAERADLSKTITKTPMCAKRKYRFLKEPRGVLPTIIQNLLDARKHTRKVVMKKCYKEIDRIKEENPDDATQLIQIQKSLIDVLDKRQLSYKVSANSMYGAMGVRKGYLPFMPGAMCTTYMGRVNIELVAETIPKEYGGKLIYGDTDSNYIHFPHLLTASETWDWALHVAEQITQLFPKPIELEFEEEIYDFFFILSKKRYMYRKCLRDGVVDKKIGKKGVLLARRDNSKFVRDLYEAVITNIADSVPRNEIISFIIEQMNELCSNIKPISDFIITKSVGNCGGLITESFVDEKGIEKAKVGDYTVPLLSTDKYIREDQLNKKSVQTSCYCERGGQCDSCREFYLLCLPAQVQLAERMKRRGQLVAAGSRLEYVVANPENHNGKQYDKIESAEYLIKHSDIVKIDFMYYLKALVNPLDQVLDVAFGNDKDYKLGFIMHQYKFRWKIRSKMLEEIKSLYSPKLKFLVD